MTKTKLALWSVVREAVKKMQSQSNSIVMYSDSEKLFNVNFDYYYDFLSDNFMDKSDDKQITLDRHKVAAIVICSILKAKVVGVGQEYLSIHVDKEFLGNEKIAFEVALSYMYTELEIDFKKGKVPYRELFERYAFPIPYSCQRSYDEVICRDLYFSEKYYDLNPLSLANLLFVIEDYSFKAFGIERIEEREFSRQT